MENVVIVGSGPAGHTAAIYAGRALLDPLLYEGFMAGGVAAGGQLTTTTDVENYPGFPTGVGGIELTELYRQQSVNCGARIETDTVDRVDLSERPFTVVAGDDSVQARTLIIATGATAKRLEVPGTERLWQKGISACAVCDGALPVFRDKPLVVIGGGDTACEESLFLTRYGSSVTILVRRDVMRASKTMQQRVLANDKINISWETELVEVLGDQLLAGVRVHDKVSGREREIEAGGLFFAIGHQPNTEFLDGQLDTDDTGYVLTAADSTATNVPGVFACGDVQDKVYRQAVTAAGTGCMAALEAERFLDAHG
ncbi:MAG: thioredoxin-disulfide reductase [Spirochaetaceae bacterium]|nr:thioredoxin-disulfide reductase [Spirochaetaceae bacterium]